MNENLNAEQINRLWEHKNNVLQEFYSRLNFFLIFESLLLGVVSTLYAAHVPSLVLKAIALLGLVITAIWVYIQARHKSLYNHIRTLCRKYIPEYNLFRYRGRWPFSNMSLLAYILPALILFIWLVFF